MNMKTTIFNLIGCAAMAVAAVSCTDNGRADIEEMRAGFVSPPASSRPGVYWYFMDGNMDKESMTRDLESMKMPVSDRSCFWRSTQVCLADQSTS